MKNSKNIFSRTDLAYEGYSDTGKAGSKGFEVKERLNRGIKVSDVSISEDSAVKLIGRPKGRYITILSGPLWSLSEKEERAVISVISSELKKALHRVLKKEFSQNSTVLVCGLGNEEITADAIGPKTVSYLTVTRHVKAFDGAIYRSLGSCSVCALRPGVVAQTGIETAELVRGAAEHVSPDAILVIDALAARSCDRLASTVQLSDTGIEPGSGIGNNRKAINRETLGVPVIALGVPTVIDSSSLIYDALSRGGINELGKDMREVLENGKNFFVSLKDSDMITKKVAYILSDAINEALIVKSNNSNIERINSNKQHSKT